MGLGFWLGFLLLVVALPLAVSYRVTRRQHGKETARKNLPVVLVCLVAGAGFVLGLRYLPGGWGDFLLPPFLFVLSLALCVGLIRFRIQVAGAGEELMFMGRSRGYRILAGVGFLGAMTLVGLSLYLGLSSEEAFGVVFWKAVAVSVLYLILCVCMVLWWAPGTKIYMAGVAGNGTFILWERIEGYAWVEKPPGVLKLRIRRRLPITREIPLRTDPGRRGEIEEIFHRFLPGVSSLTHRQAPR